MPLLPLSEDEFVAIDDSALNLAGTAPTSGFFDELGGATDVEWVIVAATIVAMLIGLRVAVVADDAVVHASSPVGCLTASAFAPLASHHLFFPFFSVPGRTASRAQQAMTTFVVLAAELVALGFFLGAPTAGTARRLSEEIGVSVVYATLLALAIIVVVKFLCRLLFYLARDVKPKVHNLFTKDPKVPKLKVTTLSSLGGVKRRLSSFASPGGKYPPVPSAPPSPPGDDDDDSAPAATPAGAASATPGSAPHVERGASSSFVEPSPPAGPAFSEDQREDQLALQTRIISAESEAPLPLRRSKTSQLREIEAGLLKQSPREEQDPFKLAAAVRQRSASKPKLAVDVPAGAPAVAVDSGAGVSDAFAEARKSLRSPRGAPSTSDRMSRAQQIREEMARRRSQGDAELARYSKSSDDGLGVSLGSLSVSLSGDPSWMPRADGERTPGARVRSPAPQELPSGWTVEVHPITQNIYYQHGPSGYTTTRRPTPEDIIDANNAIPAAASHPHESALEGATSLRGSFSEEDTDDRLAQLRGEQTLVLRLRATSLLEAEVLEDQAYPHEDRPPPRRKRTEVGFFLRPLLPEEDPDGDARLDLSDALPRWVPVLRLRRRHEVGCSAVFGAFGDYDATLRLRDAGIDAGDIQAVNLLGPRVCWPMDAYKALVEAYKQRARLDPANTTEVKQAAGIPHGWLGARPFVPSYSLGSKLGFAWAVAWVALLVCVFVLLAGWNAGSAALGSASLWIAIAIAVVLEPLVDLAFYAVAAAVMKAVRPYRASEEVPDEPPLSPIRRTTSEPKRAVLEVAVDVPDTSQTAPSTPPGLSRKRLELEKSGKFPDMKV